VTAVIPLSWRTPHIAPPSLLLAMSWREKEMTRPRIAARLATITLSAAIVVALVLPVLRLATLIVV
jgi:hypothetical protein